MSKAKLSALLLLGALTCVPVCAEEYKIQALDKDLNPIEETQKSVKEYNFSEFSLDDAIEIALQNNRSIKSSEHAVLKAEAKVWSARTAASTKVTATATKTKLDDDYKKSTITEQNTSALKLSQPLFLGKSDRAGIKSARLGRDIAKSSEILTKQNIIKAVSLAYYNWLYAREVEKVGQQDLELSQAHYDLVNKRYLAEQSSKYELLRADVRLASSKSTYIGQKNKALTACLNLLNLLALPMDTELNTSTKLEIEEINPDVLEDLENAYELREDMKIAKANQKIAKQSLVSARANGMPSVVLNAEYGSQKPMIAHGKPSSADEYWNATVAFSMPVFDASLTRAKIKEAKAGIKNADNSYEENKEKTELEIYQSALNLQTANELLASQKENLKQAEETLRLAKVRYENGLFTQIDLFDAENAWSNAKLIYLQAIYNHHSARLAYQLATGKLGRDIQGF